ncbi:MAG: alginate lyase family protein [Acidimicrobiia bacterium]
MGEDIGPAPTIGARRFPTLLPPGFADAAPTASRQSLLESADRLLAGCWSVLGTRRIDLAEPDWFHDPVTGRQAPRDRCAFLVDHRSELETGNIKQVWELSRHHHITLLAAAWALTENDAYAELAARHLNSWWAQNPFLSGVHWTSGIEIAIRLVAWTWVRRLLDGWTGAPDLFELSESAAWQLYWHQQYLAAFPSRGSSANNHVIAEAAGQLVASCAFPWFSESERWRTVATQLLEQEVERNTFPSGLNRELASDYHAFVAELCLISAAEADAAGHPLSAPTWSRIVRMVDAAAAMLDEAGRPPRQGDGDEGRALVVDGDGVSCWSSVLSVGSVLFGPQPWWPDSEPSVAATVIGALGAPRRDALDRHICRPSHFRDAGMTILRTDCDDGPEIWCRCDGGPHGFLSIAAHAHADALAIEVRHGGVDVLADPGTYCYHGEPEWRDYFRSTRAHNTVELAGVDQSVSGGPFLWLRHAGASSRVVERDDGLDEWSAHHDGYLALRPPARHRRTVRVLRSARRLDIIDRIETTGTHSLRLSFHLGPTVRAELTGAIATLEWPTDGGRARAVLTLPDRLRWTAHRGETDPVLGWYSPRFGTKTPSTTLVGRFRCNGSPVDLVSSISLDA